jgi:hypothetical protein
MIQQRILEAFTLPVVLWAASLGLPSRSRMYIRSPYWLVERRQSTRSLVYFKYPENTAGASTFCSVLVHSNTNVQNSLHTPLSLVIS